MVLAIITLALGLTAVASISNMNRASSQRLSSGRSRRPSIA